MNFFLVNYPSNIIIIGNLPIITMLTRTSVQSTLLIHDPIICYKSDTINLNLILPNNLSNFSFPQRCQPREWSSVNWTPKFWSFWNISAIKSKTLDKLSIVAINSNKPGMLWEGINRQFIFVRWSYLWTISQVGYEFYALKYTSCRCVLNLRYILVIWNFPGGKSLTNYSL